jgi:hypothetical protein
MELEPSINNNVVTILNEEQTAPEKKTEECPICFAVIYVQQNLMIDTCGHILCFDCFIKCVLYGRTCPSCRFEKEYRKMIETMKEKIDIDPQNVSDFENGIITDYTKGFYLGYIRGWEHQEQYEIEMEDAKLLTNINIYDPSNITLTPVSQERYNEMVEQTDCPICYEDICVFNNYTVTPCSHIMCSKCIYKCVRQKMNCPICRFEFDNKRRICKKYILPPLPNNIIEDFENYRKTEFTGAFHLGHEFAVYNINMRYMHMMKTVSVECDQINDLVN